MRRVQFETELEADPRVVWALLQDASVLTELTRFPKVELSGSGQTTEGAHISLYVKFFSLRFPWQSRIATKGERAFCDQGLVLPFPFTRFCHVHRVMVRNGRTILLDDVTFDSRIPNILVEWFVLKPMFAERKRTFQKIIIT